MSRSWSLLSCLLLAVAFPAAAGAQAVVRGRVRSDSSRATIPFAMVGLPAFQRTVQASISGGFQLTDVPAGVQIIAARAVGFQPFEVRIDLVAGDTLDLDLLLLPAAVQLQDLEVVAQSAKPLGKMAGFAERRRAGLGRFYDRAAIAKEADGAVLGNVMRKTAGIILKQLPWPCSGLAAATGRGTGTVELPPSMVCSLNNRPVPSACYLTVYIDGVRIWKWGDPDPPDVDRIGLWEVEAIEVYRGPSELPPAYQSTSSACGALLLWTRVGGNP